MRAFRLFLVLMLSFALPFQGCAMGGMRACTMSHAPVDRHSTGPSVHSHKDADQHTHGATQANANDHSAHGGADTSCQCSASCIGSGLISSHTLVQLQQVRPVFEHIHSESVLQAPTKRLDRPPRLAVA